MRGAHEALRDLVDVLVRERRTRAPARGTAAASAAPTGADSTRAVTTLRRRTNDQEFEGLTAAMLIMADADKRRRDLKDAILPLLEKETFMESWVYKQGEARGAARGKTEGKLEGKLEGEASALLRVLRGRGIEVPDEARERILACNDIHQLETWLDRALVAARVEDVLNGH